MQDIYCTIFEMSKPVYELYLPHEDFYNTSTFIYKVVVIKDGKRYGYIKYEGKDIIRYNTVPNYVNTRFAGYISEKRFEEMVFLDML